MKYLKFWILGSVAIAGLSFLIWMVTAQSDPSAASACADIRSAVDSAAAVVNAAASHPGMTGDKLIVAIRKDNELKSAKAEEAVRIVVNNPDCFTVSDVARAQAGLNRLTR